MKFPIFHRHHGTSRFASTEVHDAAGKPLQPLSGPEYDNNREDELVSIISVMQESENGGAYDPSGKFTYHTEQPKDLEQPHDGLASRKHISISMVDERCRKIMLNWCSKMVDYFDIDQCILAVSAYYQDRYLGTEMGKAAQNNRAIFRVVSVTSLYIAIKLRVPHRWNVTAHAFAQLCQGSITGDDIKDMEINMLFALQWNVNPPIPMEYAEAYLELIFNSKEILRRRRTSLIPKEDDSAAEDYLLPSSSSDSVQDDASRQELKDHILELVQYQLEIAPHDNRLFRVRSSLIAIAAVLNSLEGVLNENPSFHEGVGGVSFCQESIVLTLNTMASCKIASEKELEDVRTALLTSVVFPTDGIEEVDGVHSAMIDKSHMRNYTEPCQITVSPLSSSPTSSISMHEHTLTTQSVLSKVLAFHYI
mmetsp:Transcript_18566/g.34168  ORF Transcript_18566/g.34168 Transcript_18566/m.34168 type:complete len:421 (+) Transcript_18566:165-1427(+)